MYEVYSGHNHSHFMYDNALINVNPQYPPPPHSAMVGLTWWPILNTKFVPYVRDLTASVF